jgi:Phosphodiester glycosidase
MTRPARDTRSPAPAEGPGNRRPRARRWRWLLVGAAGALVAALALWIAVHRVPWLGPRVANGLRAVIGSENVTRLEETAYAVEDRANRIWRRDEAPKAYWTVPAREQEPAPPPPGASSPERKPATPAFRPADVGPVHAAWSAPGDGQWVPIEDRRRPGEPPRLYKTLLHPDKNRSWTEVFVVAVALASVDLHLMAGSREPAATTEEGKTYKRLAKIPEAHHERLLAAFNGGFMTEHGKWGMRVDGVTLVRARDEGCTVALQRDGRPRIAPWKELEGSEGDAQWWRQTPGCMVDGGQLHPLLRVAHVRNWGATLDGDTAIRRSALGLDRDGEVLFVGITNHTTAPAIAEAMRHAGAWDVAQLDVNWSYPKFLLFAPGQSGPELHPVALASGFEFSEDEYLRKRSPRDFFYLTRKAPPEGDETR